MNGMNLLALVIATVLAATGSPPDSGPGAARSASPAALVAAGRAPADAGVWPLPPPHPVVRGFDPPATRWGAGHRGVDLGGHPGETVRSVLAGRVGFAGMLAGRGVVVVDHGGQRTTYEPVDPEVSVGQRVAAGAAIGRLTLHGSHCWPRACLHWGYLRGRVYLDPLTLVGGPIRLLPVP